MNNVQTLKVVETSKNPAFTLEGYRFRQLAPLKSITGDLEILVGPQPDGAQRLQILYLLVALMQLFQTAKVEATFDESFFRTLSRLREITESGEFLRLGLKL